MARTDPQGKALTRSAYWQLIAVLVIPAALVACWLIAEAAGHLPIWLHDAAMDFPLPIATVSAAIGTAGTSYVIGDARLRLGAVLLLCSTAPLALLYPWVVAAGPLPGSFGGFSYFLGWLTRYPNWGPVNIEVLAGMVAVLATGFLPALAAALAVVGTPRRVILGTIALALLAYVPVLVRLDLEMVLVIENLRDLQDYPPNPYFGPMIRAAAMVALMVLAFGRVRRTLDDIIPPPPGSHPARR